MGIENGEDSPAWPKSMGLGEMRQLDKFPGEPLSQSREHEPRAERESVARTCFPMSAALGLGAAMRSRVEFRHANPVDAECNGYEKPRTTEGVVRATGYAFQITDRQTPERSSNILLQRDGT